jgi:DNA-directed RNA polymerase specialized sigma24 family protein
MEETMPKFTIRGTTYNGQFVDEIIDGPSKDLALAVVYSIYMSKLKRPFDIFVASSATIALLQSPVVCGKGYRNFSMHEDEVIRIGAAIRENSVVEPIEIETFKRYCESLTNGILNRLWNDISHCTKNEKADELFENIVMEFLPKYNPAKGKGRIRTYLWKKLNSRVIRDWKRVKYVNADLKEKAQPKVALLWEYVRRISPEYSGNKELTEREKIIQLSLQVAEYRNHFKPSDRRELFGRVVSLGLHWELLRSEQRKVLELIYARDMNEKQAANELAVTQPSVNKVKNTAERAYFKAVQKKFINS